jgi:hypothetical protein
MGEEEEQRIKGDFGSMNRIGRHCTTYYRGGSVN